MMQLNMLFPGYFTVCMEGSQIQKALSICSFRGIDLYDISYKEVVGERESNESKSGLSAKDTRRYYCKIPYSKYEDFISVCQKTNVQFTILSKHGGIYLLERFKQSASFFLGMMLCALLLTFYQTRIWDIRIEGNIYYDSPVLLTYLKENKVVAGIKKNDVSCIKLADQIREAFPKIKWTSVELEGSNLIVHLKENMHLITDTQNPTYVSNKFPNETITGIRCGTDLIADKNGIIESIYVRSGIANVKAGDTCKKGDILVKGQIPIYNDAAEVVRYENVEADADVLMKYEKAYYDTIDRETTQFQLKDTSRKVQLQLFHYWIKPSSLFEAFSSQTEETGIKSSSLIRSFTNQITDFFSDFKHKFLNGTKEKNDLQTKQIKKEVLTERKQLKLTSAFALPIYYGAHITYKYEEIPKYLTEKETRNQLEQEFSYFCDDLEKKGVQIYENNVKIDIMNKKGIASGRVTVLEKIGIKKVNPSVEQIEGNE